MTSDHRVAGSSPAGCNLNTNKGVICKIKAGFSNKNWLKGTNNEAKLVVVKSFLNM
jgi:hypothetical protein